MNTNSCKFKTFELNISLRETGVYIHSPTGPTQNGRLEKYVVKKVPKKLVTDTQVVKIISSGGKLM